MISYTIASYIASVMSFGVKLSWLLQLMIVTSFVGVSLTSGELAI